MGKLEARVIERSPQFLVRTGAPLRLQPEYFEHIYDRSFLNGRRTTRYLRHRFENAPSNVDFSREERLLWLWDLGERAANATRLAQSHRGEYGKFADEAAHGNFPHDQNHGRRVEAHMEALLFNISEAFDTRFPPYLIYAAALFPYIHDADQLDTEKRNRDEGLSLLPKHAHGPAGAIHVLAHTQEYADSWDITYDQARKITGTAAIMMMKHEEPGQIAQALAGKQVMPPDTDAATLTALYDTNQLDLTQLTPNQLVQIVTRKKSQSSGFVSDKSPHGLHPLFEKSYAAEIAALAQDNAPLIPDFDPRKDREALDVLTQISVFADVFDMIMPAQESIVRKLGVHKSLNRPFFRPDHSVEQFIGHINADSGHWEPEHGSDFTRVSWELMHPLGGIDGPISRSPYVQALIKETVIKGALTFLTVGTELMQGNFAPIEHIYDQRRKALAEKIAKKAGNAPNLADEDPSGRILELILEQDELINKIRKKFVDSTNGNLRYSQQDIALLKERAEVVIDILRNRHEVTDEEFARYKAELERGDFGMLPYSTYDSSDTRHEFHNGNGPKTIFSQH
jgi:hypothetical protein